MKFPIPPRRIRLYLRLERSSVLRLEKAAALSIGAALVSTFAAHSVRGIPSPIRWQITLAAENNVAVWLASMLLFGVSLVALICAGVERQAAAAGSPSGHESASTVFAWTLISAGFLLMSLDEMGSLHERLADNAVVQFVLPEIGFLEGWVAVFAVPMVLLAGAVLWTAWRPFRVVPGVLPLVAIGLLLFLSVPVQEHFEIASGAANRQANAWGRPAWQIVMEEGTELLATFCFLSAGLRYAEHRSREMRRLDGKIGLEVDGRLPLALISMYALGIAAVYLAAPDVAGAADGRGVPSNWFPATAALLGSLLAMHLAAADRNRIGSPPGSLLVLRALAGVNLAMSVGYAANFPVYHLLDNRPALQSGWIFAIGAAVLLTGMYAARISSSRVAAAGLLAWSMSFLIRPVLDPASWAPVSLIAQLALLVALEAVLAERARHTKVVRERASRDTRGGVESWRKTA